MAERVTVRQKYADLVASLEKKRRERFSAESLRNVIKTSRELLRQPSFVAEDN